MASNQYDSNSTEKGMASQFEDALLQHIEAILKIEFDYINQSSLQQEQIKNDIFKIEMCRFHFKNQILLKYLEERAELQRCQNKNEDLQNINEKMQEKKNENLNEFIMQNLSPHRAYVTFKW